MSARLDFDGDAEVAVVVDHGQFLVCAPGSEIDVDTYTDAAQSAGLAAWEGGLAVFTASNWTDTTVRVRVRRDRPVLEFDDWDHVVEGGIRVAGAALRVFGPEGQVVDEGLIELPSGRYSVVVCGSRFGTANKYGHHGGDNYTLWLWPGPVLETRVLKDSLNRSS